MSAALAADDSLNATPVTQKTGAAVPASAQAKSKTTAAETSPAEQQAAEKFRRRSEVLEALGRRAAAAPSWRTLAFDAAALVADTLETDHFALAELTPDGGALA